MEGFDVAKAATVRVPASTGEAKRRTSEVTRAILAAAEDDREDRARKSPIRLRFKNGKFGVGLLVGGPEDVYRELRLRLLERKNILLRHHFDWEHPHAVSTRPIPADVDLVVILKDMVGHPVHDAIVRECKARGILFVRSQRKWASIDHSLRWYQINSLAPHPEAVGEIGLRKIGKVRCRLVPPPVVYDPAPTPPPAVAKAPIVTPPPVVEVPPVVEAAPVVEVPPVVEAPPVAEAPALLDETPAVDALAVVPASAADVPAAVRTADYERLIDEMSTPDSRLVALARLISRELGTTGIASITIDREAGVSFRFA